MNIAFIAIPTETCCRLWAGKFHKKTRQKEPNSSTIKNMIISLGLGLSVWCSFSCLSSSASLSSPGSSQGHSYSHCFVKKNQPRPHRLHQLQNIIPEKMFFFGFALVSSFVLVIYSLFCFLYLNLSRSEENWNKTQKMRIDPEWYGNLDPSYWWLW